MEETDADTDGYSVEAGDCNDDEASISPAAQEACDGVDNNCDGAIDDGATTTFYTDADEDGFGDPTTARGACTLNAGEVEDATDCDDANADANPAMDEACDELDNDCDGVVDDGVLLTFSIDLDGDGYGDASATQEACVAPAGYAANEGDCLDTDPAYHPGAAERDCADPTDYNCDGSVAYDDEDGDGWAACSECDDASATTHPGALEVCNDIDDDCAGGVDDGATDALIWYIDYDGDGYGSSRLTTLACDAPADYVANDDDCDDTAAGISPDGIEACNGVDDDCDGTVDDGVAATIWYADLDRDGYGDPDDAASACDAPAHYVDNAEDCDDTEATISPVGVEICNDEDDDCDGVVDDGAVGTVWYDDVDGDGVGDTDSATTACDAPAGHVAVANDCDDADEATFPGAPEPCGGGDADCDGVTPEQCTSCAEAHADGYTADGLTTLDVDGATGALGAVSVWCEQTTDGGGWTLIQRTVWDWTETSLLLTDYADWYGANLGSADPGQAFRLAGANWSVVGAGGELMAVHHARDSASLGDCEPLYYTGSGGTLAITSSSASFGSLSSAASLTNAEDLSTTDAGPSTECVNGYDAVPWFYSNCCTTCPSFMGSYWSDEAHPMASYTDTRPDIFGRTTADACPSGVPVPNENGGGYEGVNVMEYYVR